MVCYLITAASPGWEMDDIAKLQLLSSLHYMLQLELTVSLLGQHDPASKVQIAPVSSEY